MGELRTLSNGMRLYVDPMPGLESAAIGVWAQAGAIDESLEENGVAHLLEHMAFKGTTRRTARRIAEEIEEVGGYLNAATSYQRTGYYARVLKNDVERAVDILADILTDPLFDEGELAKEREVVVQEIGEAWDMPDDAVNELLQAQSYRGHPLGRPILGSIESVRSHTRERLKGFMDRLYTPEKMVIAAAGAVDADQLTRWVEARFPKNSSANGTPRPAPGYQGGAAHDERDIEQTHIAIAFPGVGARHPDFFATRVFAEAMGGGMASRLFQTVREERGLAYSVYAYADCYDETGIVGAYAGTEEDKAEEAVRLIRNQIVAAADDVSEAEVARARAMLKSTVLMGLETPMGRIESASGQIFTFGAPLGSEAVREKLDAVGVEDVRRVGKRALEAGAPSIAVVGPGSFGPIARAIGAAVDLAGPAG